MLVSVLTLAFAGHAHAVTPSVDLGTAEDYSVLSGVSVTSTGATAMSESLGSVPAASLSGAPAPIVLGETNVGNAEAAAAKADLELGFADAKVRPAQPMQSGNFGGETYTSGVHEAVAAMGFTASTTLTLNGQNDPNAVFIFQIPAALTVGASARVVLTNGAQACNVFWQVDDAVGIGASAKFVGTLMAQNAVTVGAGAEVDGRVMAREAAVTLSGNAIHTSKCAGVVETGPPGPAGPAGPTGATGGAGADGEDGETGQTGVAGADGEDGEAGQAGVAGADGADGADGSQGAQGAQGQSVTSEAVMVGNLNCPAGGVKYTSVTAINYVCAGARGDIGQTGADGQSVTVSDVAGGDFDCPAGGVRVLSASGVRYLCNGASGTAGAQGAIGNPGLTGAQGVLGATGAPGAMVVAPGSTTTALCVATQADRSKARRGRMLSWTVAVTNCGTRAAANVVLSGRLGQGSSLRQRAGGTLAGGRLRWRIATLAPGATKSYKISVKLARTVKTGRYVNLVTADGDNTSLASAKGAVSVTR